MMGKTIGFILPTLTLLLVGCGGGRYTLDTDATAQVRDRASQMATAMIDRDYAVIADLTMPYVVAYVGGKPALVQLYRAMYEPSGGPDVRFLSMSFASPSDSARVDTHMLAVVPYDALVSCESRQGTGLAGPPGT